MSIKIAALFIFLLIIVSCGEKKELPKPASPEPAEIQQVAASAAIEARALLLGKAPPRSIIRMTADRRCAAMHTEDVYSDMVVVAKDGALQNVFVYIKQGLEGQQFPALQSTIEINNGVACSALVSAKYKPTNLSSLSIAMQRYIM